MSEKQCTAMKSKSQITQPPETIRQSVLAGLFSCKDRVCRLRIARQVATGIRACAELEPGRYRPLLGSAGRQAVLHVSRV